MHCVCEHCECICDLQWPQIHTQYKILYLEMRQMYICKRLPSLRCTHKCAWPLEQANSGIELQTLLSRILTRFTHLVHSYLGPKTSWHGPFILCILSIQILKDDNMWNLRRSSASKVFQRDHHCRGAIFSGGWKWHGNQRVTKCTLKCNISEKNNKTETKQIICS